MSRLLEHTAKDLLARTGLPVPRSMPSATAGAARQVAANLGVPCVVKALVPTNRREKSGAVRFADDPDEVERAAADMLGSMVGPFRVESVLVEERVAIAEEWYLAIQLASGLPAYRLLVSSSGGVNIEQESEGVQSIDLDPDALPTAEAYADAWSKAGLSLHSEALAGLTASLVDFFVRHDLTILEINPLALLTDGRLSCVGALMAVDDNALYRQPGLLDQVVEGSDRSWRPETELEAIVTQISKDTSQRGSARYLELDGGNIGFLCGGGGASLLLFDAIVAAGGQPANYSEFGGNPTEQRVYDLTRIVLSKPGVEGLFVAHNLTNNTQVDVVARGVTRALSDAGLPDAFPVVAREAGLHDGEGQAIFHAAGVQCFGEDTSLNRAAEEMVNAMQRAAD